MSCMPFQSCLSCFVPSSCLVCFACLLFVSCRPCCVCLSCLPCLFCLFWLFELFCLILLTCLSRLSGSCLQCFACMIPFENGCFLTEWNLLLVPEILFLLDHAHPPCCWGHPVLYSLPLSLKHAFKPAALPIYCVCVLSWSIWKLQVWQFCPCYSFVSCEAQISMKSSYSTAPLSQARPSAGLSIPLVLQILILLFLLLFVCFVFLSCLFSFLAFFISAASIFLRSLSCFFWTFIASLLAFSATLAASLAAFLSVTMGGG